MNAVAAFTERAPRHLNLRKLSRKCESTVEPSFQSDDKNLDTVDTV